MYRVPPCPGQRAANLLVHREKIAARLLDIDEVDDDRMRAGAHERLRLQRVVGGLVAAPGAAMNEDVYGCTLSLWRGRAENVKAFVFASAVSDALRRTENRPRAFAPGDAARDEQRAVRRVDVLIVGVVERLLIHVAPDELR